MILHVPCQCIELACRSHPSPSFFCRGQCGWMLGPDHAQDHGRQAERTDGHPQAKQPVTSPGPWHTKCKVQREARHLQRTATHVGL